jgi:RNA polymerase-binding transcription factor DksA
MHTNLRGHLERLLRERRERLLRSATACETASRGFAEERESELEESAQEAQLDRVLRLLDDRARREVVEIDAALDRIADDTYGLCIECDEPIEIDRLAVMPETDVCLSCASTREAAPAAPAPAEPRSGAAPASFVLRGGSETAALRRDANREASRPSGSESVSTEDVFERTETGVAFVRAARLSDKV